MKRGREPWGQLGKDCPGEEKQRIQMNKEGICKGVRVLESEQGGGRSKR